MFEDEKPLLLSLREPTALPPQPKPRSPGLAFLMSLLLPGAGQLYCGKWRRGILTAVFFLAGLAIAVLLWQRLGGSGDQRLEFLLGAALRTCIVLYGFGFVDAYFTAREMSIGEETNMPYNPRVGAVLNLLTRGWGYWYLDERRKGVILFVVLGLVQRGSQAAPNEALSTALGIVVEVALAVMAVDAYRIATRENRKYLDKVPASAYGLMPSSGLQPSVPVALAGLLVAGYAGLVALGVAMPDYGKLDHSQVTVMNNDSEATLTNPKYGIVMRVPSGWEFDSTEPEYLANATSRGGACSAVVLAEALLPIVPLETVVKNLKEQVLRENPNFRFLESKPAKLGSHQGWEVVFQATAEGTEVEQHYILVRRGLSIYSLVSTTGDFGTSLCSEDLQKIRENIVIRN